MCRGMTKPAYGGWDNGYTPKNEYSHCSSRKIYGKDED
jgi:hypothetical protein